MRVEQPPRKDFVSVILIRKQNAPVVQVPIDETEALLEQAQAFYDGGRDDDAMGVLRRIVNGADPSNAKAYLIIGKINLRHADMDQAISSLKTALFWNTNLIDAHIALAKIFLEKKDCQQAQNYAASALAIDENNQEAISLQRQVRAVRKIKD